MSEPAAGLILHVAGPTDEGFRTIDLWESEQAWETFRSSRLEPATATLSRSSRPRTRLRELRPAMRELALWGARAVLAKAGSDPRKEAQ